MLALWYIAASAPDGATTQPVLAIPGLGVTDGDASAFAALSLPTASSAFVYSSVIVLDLLSQSILSFSKSFIRVLKVS
jgi:hypothetical protein